MITFLAQGDGRSILLRGCYRLLFAWCEFHGRGPAAATAADEAGWWRPQRPDQKCWGSGSEYRVRFSASSSDDKGWLEGAHVGPRPTSRS